jgi:hypothetical protein
MSYQEALLLKVRRMIDETLKRWNPFTGEHAITVPREALPLPEDSPYAPAGAAFDARFLWGRPLAEGAPAEGDAYLWSESEEAFILGPAAGGGEEEGEGGAGFSAYLAAPQVLSPTPIVLPATTEIFDIGGFYDTSTYRWSPPVGTVVLTYRMRVDDNAIEPTVQIFKTGLLAFSRTGGRYSYLTDGWAEGFWIGSSNGSDWFELRVSAASGNLLAGDTFWAGLHSGGAGTGGGPLTGDVTTVGNAATIAALHGIPITTAPPNDGEMLVYNAALNKLVWRPVDLTTPDNAVTSNGDLVTSGGVYVTSTP